MYLIKKFFCSTVKTMNKRGRPLQPEHLVKKEILQVRVLPDVKRDFEKAAKLSGLSLSSWARSKLIEISRRDLESAGQDVNYEP